MLPQECEASDDFIHKTGYQVRLELDEERRQRRLDAWRLVLVNFENPLEEDYEVKRAEVGNNQYVDYRIADSLNAMLSAAEEEGITIYPISGYRSYARQVSLYRNKIQRLMKEGYEAEEAVEEAGTVVAVPGTSEHMTGLAVDLVDEHYTELEEEQEDTQGYQWLLEHCMEYGFIVRYPEEKKEITGIIYEPWHFRYVGEEHARIIMHYDICLEEYLADIEGYQEQYEEDISKVMTDTTEDVRQAKELQAQAKEE